MLLNGTTKPKGLNRSFINSSGFQFIVWQFIIKENYVHEKWSLLFEIEEIICDMLIIENV